MTSSWSSNLKKYAGPPFFEANSSDVTVRILRRKVVFCRDFILLLSLLFGSCRLSEFTLARPNFRSIFSTAKRPTDSCYSHD